MARRTRIEVHGLVLAQDPSDDRFRNHFAGHRSDWFWTDAPESYSRSPEREALHWASPVDEPYHPDTATFHRTADNWYVSGLQEVAADQPRTDGGHVRGWVAVTDPAMVEFLEERRAFFDQQRAEALAQKQRKEERRRRLTEAATHIGYELSAVHYCKDCGWELEDDEGLAELPLLTVEVLAAEHWFAVHGHPKVHPMWLT